MSWEDENYKAQLPRLVPEETGHLEGHLFLKENASVCTHTQVHAHKDVHCVVRPQEDLIKLLHIEQLI